MSKLFIVIIVCISFTLTAQDDARLSLVVGYDIGESINPGDGVNVFQGYHYGIDYTNLLLTRIRLGTKLSLLSNSLTIKRASNSLPDEQYKLKILSGEFVAGTYFRDNLFTQIGMIVDYNLTDIDNRRYIPYNGLGAMLGIGLDYHLDRIVLTFNPNFKIKSILRFDKGKYASSFVGDGPLLFFSLNLFISYKFF